MIFESRGKVYEIITYHEIFFVGSCITPLYTQHIFYQATMCFQIDVEDIGTLGVFGDYKALPMPLF